MLINFLESLVRLCVDLIKGKPRIWMI